MDDLVDICMFGPKVIVSRLRFATTAYTAALARNAKETITDIATTASDMKTMVDTTMIQQSNFIQSVEHLTLAWNNLTSSMTNYTSEIDKKTLILTNVASTSKHFSVKAPSTVSDFIPDQQVGTRLNKVPGFAYRSNFGTLTCTIDGNIGFSA
ncbi:unnamed protein product [Diatraea saccharalis]|uniref:Uncharacterized protein n=1 Tax=Diatraea saccharalis TaxID=40085 RepID=A0A9N9R744_9NEOP|nr:unnamed protein product [Diatraea saccharalis]